MTGFSDCIDEKLKQQSVLYYQMMRLGKGESFVLSCTIRAQ